MVALAVVAYVVAMARSNRAAAEWPPPPRGFLVGLLIWMAIFLILAIAW
jgi:hypothetical protein